MLQTKNPDELDSFLKQIGMMTFMMSIMLAVGLNYFWHIWIETYSKRITFPLFFIILTVMIPDFQTLMLPLLKVISNGELKKFDSDFFDNEYLKQKQWK